MADANRWTGARVRRRRGLAAAGLVCALSLPPSSALAQAEQDGPVTHFFVGLGAGVCTLVYTPLKLVYATASLPMSGLVYMWSVGDSEMTTRVVRAGTQGTYVLTPDHLRGEASIEFVGSKEEGPGEDERERRHAAR